LSFIHTFQASYESFVSDFTGEGSHAGVTQILDGSTAGNTFGACDRRSTSKSMGPEANAVEIIIYVTDTSDNYDFGFKVWGYAGDKSPAELLCDVSGIIGTSHYADGTSVPDSTTNLWADTMTVTTTHIKDWSANDSGNNRICKLSGDIVGYTILYGEFYDVSGAGEALEGSSGVAGAKIRFF